MTLYTEIFLTTLIQTILRLNCCRIPDKYGIKSENLIDE